MYQPSVTGASETGALNLAICALISSGRLSKCALLFFLAFSRCFSALALAAFFFCFSDSTGLVSSATDKKVFEKRYSLLCQIKIYA